MAVKKKDPWRPTKYHAGCDKIAVDVLKEGGSRTKVAATIGINKQTFDDWIDPDGPRFKESFSEAVGVGLEQSATYHEDFIKKNLKDKGINTQLYSLLLRNTHGWDSKQKVEVSGADGAPLSIQINIQ